MATSTLSRSERPPTVTQLSSARYRHWPFRCCSSPLAWLGGAKVPIALIAAASAFGGALALFLLVAGFLVGSS
jgi:hypothetical protein